MELIRDNLAIIIPAVVTIVSTYAGFVINRRQTEAAAKENRQKMSVQAKEIEDKPRTQLWGQISERLEDLGQENEKLRSARDSLELEKTMLLAENADLKRQIEEFRKDK